MYMTFLSHAVLDHARRVLIGNLLHGVFGESSLSQRIEKQRQLRAVTDLKFASRFRQNPYRVPHIRYRPCQSDALRGRRCVRYGSLYPSRPHSEKVGSRFSPATPPHSANSRIIASVRLRVAGASARQLECDATNGTPLRRDASATSRNLRRINGRRRLRFPVPAYSALPLFQIRSAHGSSPPALGMAVSQTVVVIPGQCHKSYAEIVNFPILSIFPSIREPFSIVRNADIFPSF